MIVYDSIGPITIRTLGEKQKYVYTTVLVYLNVDEADDYNNNNNNIVVADRCWTDERCAERLTRDGTTDRAALTCSFAADALWPEAKHSKWSARAAVMRDPRALPAY